MVNGSTITYRDEGTLDPAVLESVLRRSTLGERRPVDDQSCMDGMAHNATLTVSAWDGDVCVGVSRTLTDFVYAAYLSDLAVDEAYQSRGIGIELIVRTRARLGPKCNLILLAAPAAVDYYPKIGFQHRPQGWVLRPTDPFPLSR